jgi:hypothetical protein
MPATIGYPRERIGRGRENLELVARAKHLTAHAKTHRGPREAIWKRSEQQWRGNHWGEADSLDPDRDLVTVNVSFSTINTILPFVTGSDPSFVVEPYGGAATPQNARLLQALLNRTWRSNRVAGNQHLRRATWDYLVSGDGYLKVSYTIDAVYRAGSAEEKVDIANLWVDRINPRDLWIDPDSDGMHNARWVVHRVYRSVEELKADDRYHNTKALQASDERLVEDTGRDRPNPVVTGMDRDKIVATYEFFDIAARQLVIFVDQSEVPLQIIDEIDPPIIQLGNYTIPNSPYHMGELEQLWGLQVELNKTRTQMVEHRRRNAQKWIVRKGVLDQAGRDALGSEDVNAAIEVATDRPLNDLLAPLQVPNLSADAYAVDQVIKGDVYEISGINEYLRGAAPNIRRSATEASIIEGSTNVKTAAKLRQVEQAARLVGQMMLDTATAVYPLTDEDEMALILTGRDAQAVTAATDPSADLAKVIGARLTPNAEMFDGTYEVFVEQGSTELRNPEVREQKYLGMVQTLLSAQPVLLQLGVQINMRKALELWFEAMGIDDIDALLTAPPQQGMALGGMSMPPGGMPPEAAGSMGMAPTSPTLGVPNQAATGAPTALIGPGNSGMFPPAS